MVIAVGLVSFLIFKGIQGLTEASDSVKRKERRILKFYLPQVETASLLSITLAFVWQKAVRPWPKFMVHFILWSSFLLTLSAGILLICFQKAIPMLLEFVLLLLQLEMACIPAGLLKELGFAPRF